MKLDKMVCNEFDIDLTGSGNVNCEDISAENGHTDITGSGKVTLTGVVKNHTKETSGSGKVNIIAPETPATIHRSGSVRQGNSQELLLHVPPS